jgi:hypothetical protein
MNDDRTLCELRAACERGDIETVVKLLRRVAALTTTSLALAKRTIRTRFGSEFPARLLNLAISEERATFLRSQRAQFFRSKADSNSDQRISRKDSLMAQFGRRGGMTKCPKGFATMKPETAAAVRAAALAGRQQAKAQREAASRALEAALNQG